MQASLKCSKDKAGIIEDVYSCIRANAQQLSQFPELVPQLCLNEPDMSYCVTLAQVSYYVVSQLYNGVNSPARQQKPTVFTRKSEPCGTCNQFFDFPMRRLFEGGADENVIKTLLFFLEGRKKKVIIHHENKFSQLV